MEDFDFNLPEALIAQYPCEPRDQSRMMVIHRDKHTIECRHFYDIADYLEKEDTLVINNSRVIPARLFGKKSTGGTIEILLLARGESESPTDERWEVLLRPAKRVKIGTRIAFTDASYADVIERISEKKWILAFRTEMEFENFLEKNGRAPLPPYIKRDKASGKGLYDLSRYQTIYARTPGSVAAPTAGLHFTPPIIQKITERGVQILPVTLHVGYGTFLPIKASLVKDHTMEEEYFELTDHTADILNNARRTVAVGTTTTRVLESLADDRGQVKSSAGRTDLFIYPGYRFKKVDRLLTNFHLPRSSLFLLVCAFAGKELMLKAYNRAIEEKFRFYSYGDCMFIL